jgi:hypothetical protein
MPNPKGMTVNESTRLDSRTTGRLESEAQL